MRLLAFLLFFLFFEACQQGQAPSLEASLLPLSDVPSFKPEKAELATTQVVFRAVDGGQNWQDASAGLPGGIHIGAVIANNGELLLSCDKGMFRNSSAGSAAPKWDMEMILPESTYRTFSGRAGLYGWGEHGIFQNLSGMDVWAPKFPTLKEQEVYALLEISDELLFVACGSGVFKSTDGGKNWKRIYFEHKVYNLVWADGVLIGGDERGLLRSTNLGEHWTRVLSDEKGAHAVGHIGDRLYAVINSGPEAVVKADPDGIVNQLFISADGGQTWQCLDKYLAPLQHLYNWDARFPAIWYIHDVAQAGKYLFCSLDAGVFRSADGGKTWEFVLPASDKKVFQLTVTGEEVFAVLGEPGC